MPGFANSPTGESIMWSDNVDFSGAVIPTTTVTTNGQLLIGSTAAPHIKVGNLTSAGGSVTITNGSGTIDLAVTGGTSTVQTLTPNSGAPVGPVGGTINDKGLAANAGGNAFPLFSYNGGAGQLNWENRTYYTPYVVDASTTNGRKGTFTTIQSAINQVVADGVAASANAFISIRPGVYTESISIPSSVYIYLLGLGLDSQTQAIQSVTVSGNLTCASNAVLLCENILFTGSGTIVNTTNALAGMFNNCSFAGAIISGAGTINEFKACSLLSTVAINQETRIWNSLFNGSTANVTVTDVSLYLDFCFENIKVTLAGAAQLNANFCYSVLSVVGTSSANSTITNCTGVSFTATAGVHYSGICALSGAGYLGASSTPLLNISSMGNTYQGKRTATDYVVLTTDCYIGVTSTAAPRTVTLPVGAPPATNQIFIIKDESGAAATNNITVTTTGGARLIDGAATYVMNTNYGSIQVIYDGTNYFVF